MIRDCGGRPSPDAPGLINGTSKLCLVHLYLFVCLAWTNPVMRQVFVYCSAISTIHSVFTIHFLFTPFIPFLPFNPVPSSLMERLRPIASPASTYSPLSVSLIAIIAMLSWHLPLI